MGQEPRDAPELTALEVLQPSLNERSLTPLPSIREARKALSGLIQVLVAVFSLRGVQRVLRSIEGVGAIELADNYPLARWRNDLEVDEVERSYFRAITAWAPPIERTRDGDSIADLNDRYDFSLAGIPAIGLGTAYLTDGLAVSVLSDPRWNSAIVVIDTLIYTDAEILQGTASVLHACDVFHVETHRHFFESQLDTAVCNGEAAWKNRSVLFPHLVFGEKIKRALDPLSGDLLHQVMTRLRSLDSAANRWKEDAFDHDWIGFKATPESGPTLKKYAAERTFFCAARNAPHIFSWHLRLTPGAWRLYYEAIKPGLISIGYVGQKMSTVGGKV